jgi:cytoskeleton protein RodZ
MLQALEENKFNQLPGGIFNKGFVRAYSRCLGLDEDQTVADYLQASGDAPSVSAEMAAREDESRARDVRDEKGDANIRRLEAISDSPARQLPWGLLAAILLLVTLALFFWSRRERAQKKDALRAAPVATEAQASSMQLAETHLSAENTGLGSASSASAMATTTATAVRSDRGSAPPAPTIARKNAAIAGPTVTGAEIAGMFAVIVQAREESWISITADGKSVGSELLSSGSQRVAQGRKEVIVKAGNVGGVDFLFNGKKLNVGGEFGEVKTVTFGPLGILPNAPAPPSAP